MHIQRLLIDHFRNIQHTELLLHSRLNWVIGENGSGKTSLLEAVYCLSSGRSFRTPQSLHVIQHNTTESTLFCELKEHETAIARIGVGIAKHKKEIHLNGEVIKSASQLASQLPVQLITPKVSQLIEEGPSLRRKFLDWGLFHVEHQFKTSWTDFNRVLKQRNTLLKQHRPKTELLAWDSKFVELAGIINDLRQAYLIKLEEVIKPYLLELSDVLPIELSLYTGWPRDRDLAECLAEHADHDRQRGQTSYGPHRADIRIKTDSRLVKDVASRGQVKLISCVLLFAQLSMLEQSKQASNAVLLIDDLGAEFDFENRHRILQWALASKSQIIVTSTETALPPKLSPHDNYKMFHVEHGTFKEVV